MKVVFCRGKVQCLQASHVGGQGGAVTCTGIFWEFFIPIFFQFRQPSTRL